MVYLQLGLGLLLLVMGGEGLVRGCVALARKLKISMLLIGLTIAAYGTSAPELVVSVQAARIGATGVALGNVVGSNVANVLLILAIAALIRPIQATPEALRRDGAMVAGATILLVLFLLGGGIGRWQAIVALVVLGAIVVWTYRTERASHDAAARFHESEGEAIEAAPISPLFAPLYILLGLALLAYGADLFVEAAVSIARAIGISETVIGLTLVAIGTSLPELFTSGVAAWRGQSQLALGNVMGSNLFNALGITGVAGLVAPLVTPVDLGALDLGALLLSTLLLLVFVATGLRLVRWEALVLLALYALYVGLKLGGL